MPSYQTPRLVLRPALSTDLLALHLIMSHPECMRYWSTPPHSHISQTERYLKNMIASPTNGMLEFAIELLENPKTGEPEGRGTGLMIGKAGLWDGKEVGVLIAREEWGKGYAREALTKILEIAWAFKSQDGLVGGSTGSPAEGAGEESGDRREVVKEEKPSLQKVEKVIADIDPRNVACLALLDKLGFQRTGYEEKTFKVGEEWVDSVYLTLERPA
jgi:ribosomal-protein-alanine N-acetyltransferase